MDALPECGTWHKPVAGVIKSGPYQHCCNSVFSCCRGIEPKKLVNALGYDGTLVFLGGGTDELKGVLAFDLILAQRS